MTPEREREITEWLAREVMKLVLVPWTWGSCFEILNHHQDAYTIHPSGCIYIKPGNKQTTIRKFTPLHSIADAMGALEKWRDVDKEHRHISIQSGPATWFVRLSKSYWGQGEEFQARDESREHAICLALYKATGGKEESC